MISRLRHCALRLLLASPILSAAISLDVDDDSSIKSAAKTIAKDLLSYYKGDENGVGVLPSPYYWYESGAVWAGMVDYWAYTGDSQYNDLVQSALTGQTGRDNDYMPTNQTKDIGNFEQGLWALAAMNAAEGGFPSSSSSTSWLDLAKNVFDEQVRRWDTETCKGGLRWQIFTFNQGYEYKNSESNGPFFQLAARLAAFTGNSTYTDWAGKAYDWTKSVGLISDDFRVYDGTFTTENCSSINKLEWSFVSACFMYGSAVMYNHTSNPEWQDRTKGFLEASQIFFNATDSRGVMTEVACEPHDTCDNDIFSYKGIASQWLGATAQAAPYASENITASLRSSAKAAAQQCTGGDNGTECGSRWTRSFDGDTGVGQELSAMNVVLANLAVKSTGPAKAGSTSSNTTSSASGGQSSKPTSSVSGSAASQTAGSASAAVRHSTAGSLALFCSVLAAALCIR